MAKYEQIFSVLMVLRTQLFDLERVWTDECSLAKQVDALRDRDTVRALRRTLDEFNLLRMQAHGAPDDAARVLLPARGGEVVQQHDGGDGQGGAVRRCAEDPQGVRGGAGQELLHGREAERD